MDPETVSAQLYTFNHDLLLIAGPSNRIKNQAAWRITVQEFSMASSTITFGISFIKANAKWLYQPNFLES